MKYTQLRTDTFQTIAINAGILSRIFQPDTGTLISNVLVNGFRRRNILGATSGGITFTAVPTFADFGDDIDNCPKNTKELKRVTAWEVKASGTFVTTDADAAKQLIGGADKICVDGVEMSEPYPANVEIYLRSGSGTTADPYVYTLWDRTPTSAAKYRATTYRIVPRHALDAADSVVNENGDAITCGDFTDLWFIGDYSEKNTGNDAGFVAIRIKNALSTGGFSLVTADMEKGKFAFEFTGHYSMAAQDAVPFEVFVHRDED